jgi:transcriptional regulator with PAS, ATPase and Fis domain
LKSYYWPGNIRELQNIVERAVILSETDTLVVDERWLKTELAESFQKRDHSALADQEVEIIEAHSPRPADVYPDRLEQPRNSEYRAKRWNGRSGGWESISTARSAPPLNSCEAPPP